MSRELRRRADLQRVEAADFTAPSAQPSWTSRRRRSRFRPELSVGAFESELNLSVPEFQQDKKSRKCLTADSRKVWI